jgi:Recombinase
VLDHGESVASIARDWTARGIRPVTAKQWWPTTIVGMLISPRLAGLRDAAWRRYPAAMGLGHGSPSRCLRKRCRELLQVAAGDQAPSADFGTGQIAKANLAIQQLAGWTGRAGGLIGGVGKPPAVRVPACTASGACGDVVIGRRT